MAAVFDDVAGGHGGIAEPVDEDGFVFAFNEVDREQGADQELEEGWFGEWLVEVEVDIWSEREEDEGWDEEWPKVFDDVDGAPSELGA